MLTALAVNDLNRAAPPVDPDDGAGYVPPVASELERDGVVDLDAGVLWYGLGATHGLLPSKRAA